MYLLLNFFTAITFRIAAYKKSAHLRAVLARVFPDVGVRERAVPQQQRARAVRAVAQLAVEGGGWLRVSLDQVAVEAGKKRI